MIQDVTSALVGNTIAVLHSNDGHNRASVLNLSNRDFGKANVSDLPFGLQVLKRAELILSRYFVIDAVQLEQVDAARGASAAGCLRTPRADALGRPFSIHRSGPGRSKPALVAITKSAGYGCSASAMIRSLTSGP